MKIGFLGAGAMGGAILSGAMDAGVVKPEDVYVYDISEKIKAKYKERGCNIVSDNAELGRSSDIVVVSLKPQYAEGGLKELEGTLDGKALISVDGGKLTVAGLELDGSYDVYRADGLLIFEKYSGYDINDREGRRHLLKHIYTLFFVVCGWVLFRAESITEAGEYFTHMFGSGPLVNDGFIEYFRQYAIYIAIACFGSTPAPKKLVMKFENSPFVSIAGIVYLVIIFIVSVSFIVKNTYNPFIYFNF